MACPDCGSERATDKAEAWDALTKIPPKTENELARLRKIADASQNVGMYCGRFAPSEMVSVYVPILYLKELREALGMPATEL